MPDTGLIIPPGFLNVVNRFFLTSDPEVMSVAMGWAKNTEDPFTQTDADDLRQAFADGWGLANMASEWSYGGVTVTVGNDGPPIIFESHVVQPGTHGATNAIPNNCAYLFKKTTGFGGPSFRGRLYLPPIAVNEDQVSNTGMLDDSGYSGLQTLMNAWLGAIADTEVVNGFYLFHAPFGPLSPHSGDDPPPPTQITSFVLERQIATQRRRLR